MTILEYLRAYISKKGYAPSYREICKATGLKSTSSVQSRLNSLEAKGLIRYPYRVARGISITEKGWAA